MSTKDLSADRKKKELEAQKARALAWQYLKQKDCGPSVRELQSMKAKVPPRLLEAEREKRKTGDNTLEVLARRKAEERRKLLANQAVTQTAASAADIDAGNSSKGSDSAQTSGQNGGWTTSEHNGGDKSSVAISAKLPLGWEAVETEDGDVYYWNKVTDQTSWKMPAPPPAAAPSEVTNSAPEGTDGILKANPAGESRQAAGLKVQWSSGTKKRKLGFTSGGVKIFSDNSERQEKG